MIRQLYTVLPRSTPIENTHRGTITMLGLFIFIERFKRLSTITPTTSLGSGGFEEGITPVVQVQGA